MNKKELEFLDEVIADVQKGDDDVEPIMRMYSQFRRWFEEQRHKLGCKTKSKRIGE